MKSRTVAAVDLGAESGRVTAVSFDGRRLTAFLVNRFANSPIRLGKELSWDVEGLWDRIGEGLSLLGAGSQQVTSVGVDTWGVDYGLLDSSGRLMDAPRCYRDPRNEVSLAAARELVGVERLYSATGVQVLSINTIFGLMADMRTDPDRLTRSSRLLMMPDVIHHKLCGATVSEYTAVSTSGAFDMVGNRWATGLLGELGVPTHMLPEVAQPGTDIGPLLPALAGGRLAGARVVLPAGHDTASAVVGVPFASPGGLFISSGTWSLVGVELPVPVVTTASQQANLTNEGGYDGTIRVLRNVMGLWILQECRREWARQGTDIGYPELAEMAAGAPALAGIINPDAPLFLPPGDMPARIRSYCGSHGTAIPQTIAELVRCVLDSLALGYRAALMDLIAVTGRRPSTVNIVGGGADNILLSQLTADATGLPVYCGPTEGTALGNGAVQLATAGEFGSLADIRRVLADSFPVTRYEPRPGDWDSAGDRFRRLVESDAADQSAFTDKRR